MESERLTLTPEDEKIIKKQAFRSAFCGAGLSTPVASVLVFGAVALVLSYFHNLTHVITPWIITVFAISVLPPIAYGAFCLESAKKFNRSEYWFSLVSRVNTHITDDTPLSDLTPLVSVGSPESNGGVAVALGVAISSILYDNLKKVADKLNEK